LETEFDLGMKRGTWLFLFDSFDEIPEVLADSAINRYAESIADFLGGFNTCRGIVASRQFRGPGGLGWSHFRILGLSKARQMELIHKAALEKGAEMSLVGGIETATEEIRAMAANPMFLGLLTEYVRSEASFPFNAHVVFEQYVQSRLQRDSAKIARRFGLSSSEVRTTAESAAFSMAADPGLGLTPSRTSLKMSMHNLHLPWCDAALDALNFVKLARSEQKITEAGDASFTFAHRRFQEYFATWRSSPRSGSY
jgi:hypothetical protein